MPPDTGLCEICGGSGFVLRSVDGYERAATCRCRVGDRSRRRLESAVIPPRYRHCELDNYEVHHESQLEARSRARDFAESYPPANRAGLLFSGPCGVGKTHLAVGVLRHLVQRKGVEGLFVDFRDLLKQIQETYRPDHPLSASQVIRPILHAEVLLLDDLGAAKMTDWVRDILGHLISQRYNQERITLFTTHFSDAEATDAAASGGETLAERIGASLRSRLDEMCRVVVIAGRDYRRSVLRATDRI